MPTSRSTGVWNGDLQGGSGSFEASSGAFRGDLTFGARFGDEPGTNPEELLAAAHAGCFSMALANALADGGHEPEEVRTEAACTLEQESDGPAVTRMELDVTARVPGIDDEAFRTAVDGAKQGCPISRALGGGTVSIEVNARREG